MAETSALRVLAHPLRRLEATSVDDTLELLDLLMAAELVNAELVNKAHTTSDKEKVRKHPKLARAPGAIRELRAPDATDEDDE